MRKYVERTSNHMNSNARCSPSDPFDCLIFCADRTGATIQLSLGIVVTCCFSHTMMWFHCPDPWENRTYYFDDLARISDALYQDGDLKIVLLDVSARTDPVYKSDIDPLREPQQVSRLGNYPDPTGEHVAIRSYSDFTERDLVALHQSRNRLLVLGRDQAPERLKVGDRTLLTKPIVRGERYWLSEALGAW
jgi:hypothetical protein